MRANIRLRQCLFQKQRALEKPGFEKKTSLNRGDGDHEPWRRLMVSVCEVAGFNLKRPDEMNLRPGLVFKAHRLVYHSTLGWRVIKKEEKKPGHGQDVSCLVPNGTRTRVPNGTRTRGR